MIMAIYMEYEGIQGNVTAEGYQNMIQLDFAVLGMSRAISMKSGEMANRESAIPRFSIIKTGKRLERSTVPIINEIFSATTGKLVKIHFVRTGTDTVDEYMTYTLDNCIPTYYSFVATERDGCVPVESLDLSYSALGISRTSSGAKGAASI